MQCTSYTHNTHTDHSNSNSHSVSYICPQTIILLLLQGMFCGGGYALPRDLRRRQDGYEEYITWRGRGLQRKTRDAEDNQRYWLYPCGQIQRSTTWNRFQLSTLNTIIAYGMWIQITILPTLICTSFFISNNILPSIVTIWWDPDCGRILMDICIHGCLINDNSGYTQLYTMWIYTNSATAMHVQILIPIYSQFR